MCCKYRETGRELWLLTSNGPAQQRATLSAFLSGCGGALWWAGQATTSPPPGVGGSRGQPAETQSAAVQLKVLLFLLLAEQTAVTQKMCAGAEGETQSLALTSTDAILVPDLLLASVSMGVKWGSRAV